MIEQSLKQIVKEALREVLPEVLADVVKNSTPAPSVEPEYLEVKAAAKVAGVCDETIREWVRKGKLTEHRAGRHMRIKASDLHRFMAGDQDEPSEHELEQKANEILKRGNVLR